MTPKSFLVKSNAIKKTGPVTINLLINLDWLISKKYAIVKRALLNTLSTDVIGAATAPNTAKIPPTLIKLYYK